VAAAGGELPWGFPSLAEARFGDSGRPRGGTGAVLLRPPSSGRVPGCRWRGRAYRGERGAAGVASGSAAVGAESGVCTSRYGAASRRGEAPFLTAELAPLRRGLRERSQVGVLLLLLQCFGKPLAAVRRRNCTLAHPEGRVQVGGWVNRPLTAGMPLLGLQVGGPHIGACGQSYLQMLILDYFIRLKLHIQTISLFSNSVFLFRQSQECFCK